MMSRVLFFTARPGAAAGVLVQDGRIIARRAVPASADVRRAYLEELKNTLVILKTQRLWVRRVVLPPDARGYFDGSRYYWAELEFSSDMPAELGALLAQARAKRRTFEVAEMTDSNNQNQPVLRAFFDGASSGNPGPAGCAWALEYNGAIVEKRAVPLGETTNNVAEWTGALKAIQAAKKAGWRKFQLVGDSQLVIKQLRGEWKVKDETLAGLASKVRAELNGLEVEFVWVPREQNAVANELAQAARDEAAEALSEDVANGVDTMKDGIEKGGIEPGAAVKPYAVIVGTREPDAEQVARCKQAVRHAIQHGYQVVSGGAPGIDTIVATTAHQLGHEPINVLPWRGHSGESLPGRKVYVPDDVAERGRELVRTLHPAPERLSRSAWALHIRNYAMLADAPEGSIVIAFPKIGSDGQPEGGTAMAVRIAVHLGIPCKVWVAGRYEDAARLMGTDEEEELLESNADEVQLRDDASADLSGRAGDVAEAAENGGNGGNDGGEPEMKVDLRDRELFAAWALDQMEKTGAHVLFVEGVVVLRKDIIVAQRPDGSDALIIRRGSLTDLSLRIAAGEETDRERVTRRLYQLFVESRREDRSQEAAGLVGISAPAAGLKGLTHEEMEMVEHDPKVMREIVVEVGVPSDTLRAMAAVHGYRSVSEFLKAVNSDQIPVLLTRQPSTSAHRAYLHAHLRAMGFGGGRLYVAPSTMKVLFGDQDGDLVYLMLPAARPKDEHVEMEDETGLMFIFERPRVVGRELPKIEAMDQIGLKAVADGRFLPNLFEGLRALVGANAKSLVGHWMTMVNGGTAAIYQLLGPEAAARFYDKTAPLTEEIMDAGKETSGGAGELNRGLPFGAGIASIIYARSLHEMADLLMQVADGVEAFFGGEKGVRVANEIREAAEIVKQAAVAHDERADKRFVERADKRFVEHGLTDPRVLPVAFSVMGYLRHILPDPEALRSDLTATAGGFMSLPKPVIKMKRADVPDEMLTAAVQLLRTTPEVTLTVPRIHYEVVGVLGAELIQSPQLMSELVTLEFEGELSVDGVHWMPADEFAASLQRNVHPVVQVVLERHPELPAFMRLDVVAVVGLPEDVLSRDGRSIVKQRRSRLACIHATPYFVVETEMPDGRPLAIRFENERMVRAIVEPTTEGAEIVDAVSRVKAYLIAAINERVRKSSLRSEKTATVLEGHAILMAQDARNAMNDFFGRHGVLLAHGDFSGLFYRQTIEISQKWLQAIDTGGVMLPMGKESVRFLVPAELGYESIVSTIRALMPENALMVPMKKGAYVVFLADLGRDEVVDALGSATVVQNVRRIAREAIPDKALPVHLPDGRVVRRVTMRAVIGSVDGFTGVHGDSTEGMALLGLPGKLEIARTLLVPEKDFGAELVKALRAHRGFQLMGVDGKPVQLEISESTTPDDLINAGVDMQRMEAQVTADAAIVSYQIRIVAVTDRIHAVKVYVTDGMVKGMASIIRQDLRYVDPSTGDLVPIQLVVGAEAVKSKTSVGTVLTGMARLFGADLEAMEQRLRDAWRNDTDRKHEGFLRQVQAEAEALLEHVRQTAPEWILDGDVTPVPIVEVVRVKRYEDDGTVHEEEVLQHAGFGYAVEVEVAFDDDTDLTSGTLPTHETVGLPGRDVFVLNALAAEGVLHPALGPDFKYPYIPNEDAIAEIAAIRHILQQARKLRDDGPDGPAPRKPRQPEPPAPPAPKGVEDMKAVAAAFVDAVLSMGMPKEQQEMEQQGAQQQTAEPEPAHPEPAQPEPERKAYFDGASSGNPGPAGCAFVLVEDGREVAAGSKHVPSATNNQMEWAGALAAVKMAVHRGWKRFQLIGDSQLVIKQLRGEYKIKEPEFQRRKAQIDAVIQEHGLQVEFVWVPREQNSTANQLAQDARDGKEVRR